MTEEEEINNLPNDVINCMGCRWYIGNALKGICYALPPTTLESGDFLPRVKAVDVCSLWEKP